MTRNARHARPRPPRKAVPASLSILTALALLVAGLASSIGAPAASAAYGSGELGNWSTLSHGTVGDVINDDTNGDGIPEVADVLLVGDSITTATYPETQALIEQSGHTFAVNYWSGRPTENAVSWILSLSTKPKLIVLASGTNDLMNPPAYATQLARLKAGLPADVRVMVVEIQAARPDTADHTAVADQRNSAWLNSMQRDQFAPADIIGWFRLFAANPARIDAYLKPDGVHTNGTTGDAFRAAAIATPVIAALGGPTGKKKR